jgi:hypothetical protein
MTRRKSFGTPDKPVPPLEIEVLGQTFQVDTQIPGTVLLNFMASTDQENPAKTATALRSFLERVIKSEDRERWIAFIDSPEAGVTMDILAEVAGYLAEEIGGGGENPTQQL